MKKTKAITLALLTSLPGLSGCSSTPTESQDSIVEEHIPGPPPPAAPEMIMGSTFTAMWTLEHPGQVVRKTIHHATGQTSTSRSGHYYGRRAAIVPIFIPSGGGSGSHASGGSSGSHTSGGFGSIGRSAGIGS